MAKKPQVEVKDGNKWITVWRYAEMKRGMLHYELKDGTNAFALPGEWRVKGAPEPTKEQRVMKSCRDLKPVVTDGDRNIDTAVYKIRVLAQVEHGVCPEEYTSEALREAITEDGRIPSEEEMEWLVMGKEDDEGANVPEWLAEKYPHLNSVLAAIF